MSAVAGRSSRGGRLSRSNRSSRSRWSAPSRAADPAEPVDLRLVPVAIGTWVAVLVGLLAPTGVGVALAGTVSAGALILWWRRGSGVRRPLLVVTAAVIGGTFSGCAQTAAVDAGPIRALAASGAAVQARGVVVEDPRSRSATFDPDAVTVTVRVRLEQVTARGRTTLLSTPVVVVSAEPAWTRLLPGQPIGLQGVLAPSDRRDVAAVLRATAPEVQGPPSVVSRATEPLRAGLRQAAGVGWQPGRGLVPALVVGDETMVSAELTEDMRASGLTHLTAVSGTNVTIIIVCVLALARLSGVRGYALPLLGLAAVVGFVLLARPEPSVIRAGVMGGVAVIGLTVAGRRRGLPALATATVVLLVVDPWLAQSAGFALSVLATGAILVLVPAWRDQMTWLPPVAATTLMIPLAAQVACLPVLVIISDRTSLASVPANLLAAPAVPAATVLGALAAVVAPWWSWLAGVVAAAASVPASWIALVARHSAALPGAEIDWWTGTAGVIAAVAVSAGALFVLPLVLRRLWATGLLVIACAIALLGAPTPGWPPAGWVVVACDVGQGDAFVLSATPGSAVVVDTGPDPSAVRRCLDRLGVRHVPLLILTHGHADHVGGLAGVLQGRVVDAVLVSPFDDRPLELADAAWRPAVEPARVGDRIEVGDNLELEVLWPRRVIGRGGEAENNISIVVMAESAGIRLLFTGDLEPAAQRALVAAEPDLRADVLKVAHHGSAHQHPELVEAVAPRLALIGVGADNTFGHPAPSTLTALTGEGSIVHRTDVDGSLAVVVGADGSLQVHDGGPRVTRR